MKRPQGKLGADTHPGPEAERRFVDALKAALAMQPRPLKDKVKKLKPKPHKSAAK